MIPQQLYDIFIGFEEESAALYFSLAERFDTNAELSWFWVAAGMEEKQHAGLLQYCKDTRMFGTNLPGNAEIQRLAALFKSLRRQIEDTNLTVDQAFETAIALEASEIGSIFQNLVANLRGPWYVIRKKLELTAENHVTRLAGAAQRFGASPEICRKFEQWPYAPRAAA
jgi:hypothetical protein